MKAKKIDNPEYREIPDHMNYNPGQSDDEKKAVKERIAWQKKYKKCWFR